MCLITAVNDASAPKRRLGHQDSSVYRWTAEIVKSNCLRFQWIAARIRDQKKLTIPRIQKSEKETPSRNQQAKSTELAGAIQGH